jgi:hypothetical protein
MSALVQPSLGEASLGPVITNSSHPSVVGLGFLCWFGNGGPGIDLVSGTLPTTVTQNVGVGSRKGLFNPSSTNLSWQEWSYSWVTDRFASRSELSMMVRFTQRTSTENKQGAFLNLCNANGGGYNLIQGVPTAYGVYINGGSQVNYSGLTAMRENVTYTLFVAAGSTNSRIMAFANGGIASDVSTAALTTTSASLSRIRIAGERGSAAGGAPSSSGGFSPVGEVHLAAIWNRRLSIQEMVTIANAPLSLVRTQMTALPQPVGLGFRGWGFALR